MKNKEEKEVIFFYASKANKKYIKGLAKKNKRSISFCMNFLISKTKKLKNVGIPKRD